MGAYLETPKKEKEISRDSNDKLEYLSIGMQGWRTSMEDASIEALSIDDQGTCVFGVFDGHGGSEVATYVAQHFIPLLKANNKFKKKNYIESLKEVFLQIDKDMQTDQGKKQLKEIKQKADEGLGESDAGCTANVVLISFPQGQEKIIICANAGDARSIVVCNDKIATPLSQDHKPLLPNEKERILKAGGFVTPEGRVNGNLNLSRAFGDFEYKSNHKKSREEQLIVVDPDICNFKSNGNEKWLMIGCDGVWEMLQTDTIVEFIDERINKGIDLKIIMDDLFEELVAKDTMNGVGCDNMTAIIINLKNNKFKK